VAKANHSRRLENKMRNDSIAEAHRIELVKRQDSILSADYIPIYQTLFDCAAYRHKSWMKTDTSRCALIVLLCKDGSMHLVSTMPKRNVQPHNRIVVRLTKDTIDVDTIPIPMQWGMPFPNVEYLYINGKRGQMIIDSIVAHPNEKITVDVYRNQTLLTSYNLPEADRKAIASVVELAKISTELYELNRKRRPYQHHDWDD
jgi:hypothetical protein